MRYEIDMNPMSDAFLQIWKSAGLHLGSKTQNLPYFWLRDHPRPPFLEHLSFKIGNQLFFVRVVDNQGKVKGPGSINGLKSISEGCNGHACILPMNPPTYGSKWEPVHSGWGLLDCDSGAPIDPFELVTDESVEMTDWELHDFAVQVVRQTAEQEGKKVVNWHSNPGLTPSIWLAGDGETLEWVIVKAGRFPAKGLEAPADLHETSKNIAQKGCPVGYFAPVIVASHEQPFISADEPAAPLLRGHGLTVKYEGLEPV